MFFGIPQPYAIDIYGFYFEEYMLGYLFKMISCRPPPPPRRVMGPAGTVDGTIGRFLLPIGWGGSAEVAWKFYFLIKIYYCMGLLAYIVLENNCDIGGATILIRVGHIRCISPRYYLSC